jgi:hypothetical protein
VRRAQARSELQPGAIEHVLRYRGAEQEGHADMDTQWRDSEGRFSQIGRLAINASKELIRVVLAAAVDNLRGIRHDEAPFDVFQRAWLAAAPILSRAG